MIGEELLDTVEVSWVKRIISLQELCLETLKFSSFCKCRIVLCCFISDALHAVVGGFGIPKEYCPRDKKSHEREDIADHTRSHEMTLRVPPVRNLPSSSTRIFTPETPRYISAAIMSFRVTGILLFSPAHAAKGRHRS